MSRDADLDGKKTKHHKRFRNWHGLYFWHIIRAHVKIIFDPPPPPPINSVAEVNGLSPLYYQIYSVSERIR